MKEDTVLGLKEIDHEIFLIEHMISLLHWDQETLLPAGAVEERAEQISFLEGILHDRVTSPLLGDLLAELGGGNPGGAGQTGENPRTCANITETDALVRLLSRQHERNKKVPRELVTLFAREASVAQSVWVEARKRSDFSMFSPYLEKIVEFSKEKAQALGSSGHYYDSLLDEFEPSMTVEELDCFFGDIRKKLPPLIGDIRSAPQVEDSFLNEIFPVGRQEAFCRNLLEMMGFDFSRGVFSVSAHPFTTTPGKDDVRITTMYKEKSFKTALFGTLHECGHALYEQGFGESHQRSKLASGTSLAIHESQSRIWENMIGRSGPFWECMFPVLYDFFPDSLKGVAPESFFKAVNKVEPSLIRVEADEVTYNLHILLRYDLEKALVSGAVTVRDLPHLWNKGMTEYFGITPENDAEGILQDVHWSLGIFGYFPTYTLGNLYGAQFFHSADRANGGMGRLLVSGNFPAILEWFRAQVHQHGARYTASELVNRVTGEPLSTRFFTDYLEEKYKEIYFK